MSSFFSEYLPILIFIFIAFALAIGMTAISFIVGESKPDNEKLSSYECGFEAFDDARGRFDVRFYLVAILFIICGLYGVPQCSVEKKLLLTYLHVICASQDGYRIS